MFKKALYLYALVGMLCACTTYREVADETFKPGWIRYQCGIYQLNFDQQPSKAIASILKNVDGVYYVSEEVPVGKHEVALERVSDSLFKVKDRHFYLELRGSLPNRNDYHGILEVKPVRMLHPWKENSLYKPTAEFFHLSPFEKEK